MTDYSSNRAISEAYSRMYEGVAFDGTIDDSRRYRIAVDRVADYIMWDIVDALGSDDYAENERSESFDCTPPTYMPLRVETDCPITPERLRGIISSNHNFYKDEVADFLESSNAVRVGTLKDHKDHMEFTLARTVTIPLLFDGLEGDINIRVVVSEGYSATDAFPRKGTLRTASGMFRKNLRKPNFPDSVSESDGPKSFKRLRALAAHKMACDVFNTILTSIFHDEYAVEDKGKTKLGNGLFMVHPSPDQFDDFDSHLKDKIAQHMLKNQKSVMQEIQDALFNSDSVDVGYGVDSRVRVWVDDWMQIQIQIQIDGGEDGLPYVFQIDPDFPATVFYLPEDYEG